MPPHYTVLLFTAALFQAQVQAQAPIITAAVPVSTTVEQWGKFEVKLTVNANWANPYDYEEIRVEAVFTGPNGQTRAVEGFFIQEYEFSNQQTGAISPVGAGVFKVRFSPDQSGTWRYQLRCTNASGTGQFAEQAFSATPTTNPRNKGFVRADQGNYLHFDQGAQYIPIGENIGWHSSNALVDYKKWLTKLSDKGGNFFRMWQCHWGLGLEWRNNDNGYTGLRKYKQTNAFYTDWLFDFCAERGIYVMYCLQHHGQVSSTVNPNWAESPYNAVNGGPCANTWDFFTAESAKKHQRNKYRYCVARWGYSQNLMAWELFNEVDWTDQFEQKKSLVSDWHNEMAAFLKNKDPYGHLVTTSYAKDQNDPDTWNLPDVDFTQTHYYNNTPNIERVLRNGLQKYLGDFGKPTINGEFGLDAAGNNLQNIDPNGIHIHNGLWGSLFSGAFGTAMTWWWDSYIDPKELYHHFTGVAAVSALTPLREKRYAPVAAGVTGVPADLSLTPTGGWAALTDTLLRIDATGAIEPAGATTGTFLYGSQWNTQYRRPPKFVFTMPQAGKFRVRTGGQAGQAPKIAIWLDGVKVLEQAAAINQNYTIDVPAGPHNVKVDNTGTDWILIASYTITGIGSAVDAYVLQSEDKNRAAGWVLNNRYNHEVVQSSGNPAMAAGAVVQVPGQANGTYVVRYYNCLTGALLSTETAAASNGALRLVLPEFQWDLAFTADEQAVGIAEVARQNLDFQTWPNPVLPGVPVTLQFQTTEPVPLSVSLLDGLGRAIETLYEGRSTSGEQQLATMLPATLPAGLYWVKVEAGTAQAGARAISIVGER